MPQSLNVFGIALWGVINSKLASALNEVLRQLKLPQ